MQRFRALCQRYAGWIVVTFVLLLCQRWWIARNKPERLLELPTGYEFTRLHDGILYLKKSTQFSSGQSVMKVRRPGSGRPILVMTSSQPSDTPALFAMPVSGGPLRPVPPNSIAASPPEALFTLGTDMYHVEYQKSNALVGIPPRITSGAGVPGGLGASTPSTPPPPPKPPFRTVTYREEADGITATLRRVASSGELAGETLTCSMGYTAKSRLFTSAMLRQFFKSKIAFAGDAVYWLKGFPDESAVRVSSNRQDVGKPVYKYRSAVMTMSLRGGMARKLLDNVPEDTNLFASEDGVLCRIRKENQWDGWECLRVRPDGTSQQIPAWQVWGGFPFPVAGNHCLYWDQDLRIMQVNADGSGKRVLYTADPKTSSIEVYPWRERVYFCVMEVRSKEQTASGYKYTLYCVNPSLPSGVERLCALADNMGEILFDGDYVYFLAREEKTGFMDDASRSDASVNLRNVLYRFRLPAK